VVAVVVDRVPLQEMSRSQIRSPDGDLAVVGSTRVELPETRVEPGHS